MAKIEPHERHCRRKEIAVREAVKANEFLISATSPRAYGNHCATRKEWSKSQTREPARMWNDEQRRENREAESTGDDAEKSVADGRKQWIRFATERCGDALQTQLKENLENDLQQ